MADDTSPRGLKRPTEHTTNETSNKRLKPTYGELHKNPVDILVGNDPAEIFHCFAPLLGRYSSLFSEELTDELLAGYGSLFVQIPTLNLPCERPADFERYREWMDKECLYSNLAELRSIAPYDLARLFLFANRIRAPKLKNDCMDCLHMKTRDIIWRLSQRSKEQGNENLNAWKRAVRWIVNTPEICPESSGLYKFFRDFFAYFILQMARTLEYCVLSDLPTSFLWDILQAVTTALMRHTPGAPTQHAGTSTKAAGITITTSTTTTTISQIGDKMVRIVQINDSDDEDAKNGAAAAGDAATETTKLKEGEEEVALKALNPLHNDYLINAILAQSAVMRAIVDGKLAHQQLVKPKKRDRPFKNNTTTDSTDDDSSGSNVEKAQSKKQSTAMPFFGVANLCVYHVHTSAERARACARKFRVNNTKEVWPVVPLLRT